MSVNEDFESTRNVAWSSAIDFEEGLMSDGTKKVICNTVATSLLAWFDQHGRKNLPWQQPRTAYQVWLSEIMLQQTQVATVIPYFKRFVGEIPTLAELAAAPLDRVLALWSGLGYYSRARNLHRAAQICLAQHEGELPADFEALIALPGIGPSTAGAILAQAYDLRFPILDGNVKRVLTRLHGIFGWPGITRIEKELWNKAAFHTPQERVADYTQAIMDLGATVCTRTKPHCDLCPLAINCVAYREKLTQQLPERKPKRSLPSRNTTMFVIRNKNQQILLEHRPPIGIWASLWSLPEARDNKIALSLFIKYLEIDSTQAHNLPAFTHGFSHYTLAVTPLLIDLPDKLSLHVADDPNHRWCSIEDIAALGLPAPVRKLLNRLWNQEQ